jgi:glycerol-3-phosphate dehydrogenase (NAD(P)+)
MKISVVGSGRWGTALAHAWSSRGHDVMLYCRRHDIAEEIEQHHSNSRDFPKVLLSHTLRATTDIASITKADIVVLAVPSSAFVECINLLSSFRLKTVVSATKGVVHDGITPLSYLQATLNSSINTAVLSGPSFSLDVISLRPLGVVIASHNESIAHMLAHELSSPSMKVYHSTDTCGVEWGGIAKNVIAIAAGVARGAQCGDSAHAALITRGLAELTRFATHCGAHPATLAGLSGLGDLVMTSSSIESRNFRFGFHLGEGYSVEASLLKIGSTVEGIRTAPFLLRLSHEKGVEMPITEQVTMLLEGKTTPERMAQALLTRSIKKE